MPRRLLRTHTDSFYHCISRTTDRQRTMHAAEKRHFHRLMSRLSAFSGVQVVTYCLMENHFHLLVRVPQQAAQPRLTEESLRRILPFLYQRRELKTAIHELDQAAESSDPNWLTELLERYQARRFSLSIFLKELKQRYTRWHNRRHRRVGTLWEHRFRSVLVEGDERALLTIAAYIDLNPVRAGIVTDPKDYIWCGYAEAVAGKNAARQGIRSILEHTSFGVNRRVNWREAAPRYRVLLYGHGERRTPDAMTGSKGRSGVSRAALERVLEAGGKLSNSEILLCRVRYLTHGGAIGGAEFLQQVFEENRERFSDKRTTGGRRMSGADWHGLRVLRDLQKHRFG